METDTKETASGMRRKQDHRYDIGQGGMINRFYSTENPPKWYFPVRRI